MLIYHTTHQNSICASMTARGPDDYGFEVEGCKAVNVETISVCRNEHTR